MIASDYPNFSSAWESANEVLVGTPISENAMRLAFKVLSRYELDDILPAIERHVLTSKFRLTPAEVVEGLTGKIPDADVLAGLARSANTLLGFFLRRKLGAHDMGLLNDVQLRARIKSHAPALRDFINRAQKGEYSDAELRLFVVLGLDPCRALCPGVPGPRAAYRAAVQRKAAEVVRNQPAIEHQKPPEPTEEERAKGAEALAQIMNQLNIRSIPQ